MPALLRAAEDAGRPAPGFAPRLPLLLTDSALDDDTRLAGQGTLDQVRRDLDGLAELGATHVRFDTCPGTPDEMRSQEADHRMLDALAAHLLD